MSDFSRAMGAADTRSIMCNCIGPRPGHTLCPCMERIERSELAAIKAKLIEEGWTPPKGKQP